MEQLDLLPKLKPAHARPVEPILRSADIEDCYRWTLRRAWGAGGCLGVAMLNPSDAGAERDDPTMWSVMKHACRLGFGSVVVVNLYPFITPQVPALRAWRNNPANHEAIVRNRHVACTALVPCERIMFGWGNSAEKLDVDAFVEHLVSALCGGNFDEWGPEINFYCLGTTASGAPLHPLARGKHRIPADQKLVIWKQP